MIFSYNLPVINVVPPDMIVLSDTVVVVYVTIGVSIGVTVGVTIGMINRLMQKFSIMYLLKRLQ